MEISIKKWGLISTIILALLSTVLVTIKMLTTFPESNQGEVLTTRDGRKPNEAVASQNGALLRLEQMEKKFEKKHFQENISNTAPVSGDIELLQRQVDTLSRQVSELTKAVSKSGDFTSPRRNDGLRQFQTASNDPVMQQKFYQYQQDLSLKHANLIDQTFQNEPVDDSWATELQTNIESDFYTNESLTASELLSVDCRTSICRLTVSIPKPVINDAESATESFILENELLASISREMPRAKFRSQPNDKGGLEYEIFLFREGYQQPNPQNPLEGKNMSEMIEYIERY